MVINAEVIMRARNLYLVLSICLLSACGGSESNEESTEATTTSFSLAISDAPIDDAISVMVYFDEVILEGNGESISIDITDANGQAKAVDLLTVQGSNFASLIDDQSIPLGQYSQLRLSVTSDSYIELVGGTFPLQVPSGELKLGGITALANVTAAYTVEFDLRKSLVDPVGQQVIFLKPRGVRLVANNDVGILKGTVTEDLVLDASCANKLDPMAGNSVYLYTGIEDDVNILGDDADQPADTNEVSPFTTANVAFNQQSQAYEFEAGYLPVGDYTLAFTCQALIDQPETDENAIDGFNMLSIQAVNISAQQTTVVTIEPTAP
jgi:hypothetical protein